MADLQHLKQMIETELHSFERENKEAAATVLTNQVRQQYSAEMIAVLKGFLAAFEEVGEQND